MNSKTVRTNYNRIRLAYFIAIAFTIVLGLASRNYSYLLPDFVAQNAGDILWSMMVYFGFRFLLVRQSSLLAIFLSFLFSFGIEFSQLVQNDWINNIRNTSLGALILGRGFLFVDLIRYTVGIIIASLLDTMTDLSRKS